MPRRSQGDSKTSTLYWDCESRAVGTILVRAWIIGDPPPYVNCHTVRPNLRRLHLPDYYLTKE